MESIKFSKLCSIIAIFITLVLFSAFIALVIMINLSEFINSLNTREMQYSLQLTLTTALISTFLSILIGVPTAYAIARENFLGKSLVKTVLDVPMALPEIVLGMALLLLFGHTPIASILKLIGIEVVFTPLGIIIAQFFSSLPFVLRILTSTFGAINPRYELVSRSLGYSELETFLKITMPLSKNGLFASTVVAFARSVGAFGSVIVLAGGIYMQTETLPITLYLNISYGNLSMAISAGILLIIVSFITIFIIEKMGVSKLWSYSV